MLLPLPPAILIPQLTVRNGGQRNKEGQGVWKAAAAALATLAAPRGQVCWQPPSEATTEALPGDSEADLPAQHLFEEAEPCLSTTESQGGPRALHQSWQQDKAKQPPCLVKPQED